MGSLCRYGGREHMGTLGPSSPLCCDPSTVEIPCAPVSHLLFSASTYGSYLNRLLIWWLQNDDSFSDSLFLPHLSALKKYWSLGLSFRKFTMVEAIPVVHFDAQLVPDVASGSPFKLTSVSSWHVPTACEHTLFCMALQYVPGLAYIFFVPTWEFPFSSRNFVFI